MKNVGDKIWAKKDEEVEVRVLKGLVFGTKELLVTWGFDKMGVWADPETGSVWMGDDKILTRKITGRQLTIEYGTEWEVYFNDSLKELVTFLKVKLATGNNPTKGLGKGKGKQKGKTMGSGK